MNYYWGFGLTIASEIEFPELSVYESDAPDIKFVIGKTPEAIAGEAFSGNFFSYIVHDKAFLFTAHGVARYYAVNGNKVLIEPVEPVENWREVRLYLLATVMAAVLLQRNILPVHASAIVRDNKLVLITGDSRAGKSTTLAGLLKKGYTVFSDDVIAFHPEANGTAKAAASYPMIKLWDDTIEKLNAPLFDNRSFRVQKKLDKYGIFFHAGFDKNRYPVKTVFILKAGEVSQPTALPLAEGKNAFEALVRQVYRPMLLINNEARLLCFSLISDIVKNCKVVEVHRPQTCKPEDLVDFIESLL